MYKIGDRVGAILSSKDGVVDFLGFGVYEGEEIPEEAIGWMADVLREANIFNPCIKLDSGKKVYGCECWWGDAEKVTAELSKYKEVHNVDIDNVREQYKKDIQ